VRLYVLEIIPGGWKPAPGGSAALRAAEAEVTPALPVRTQVRHAWLMTGTQALASWRVVAELPLGT